MKEKLADRVGFEPTEPARARQFSRLVFSTAQPSVRRWFYGFWAPVSRIDKNDDASGLKKVVTT